MAACEEQSTGNGAGRHPFLTLAAYASLGAGVIHGGAIGIHAEHPALARVFVAITLAQIGWGVLALQRPERPMLLVGIAVNAVAVGGWLTTRFVGLSWMSGLESSKAPQVTDTVCAALGATALVIALAGLVVGRVATTSARTVPSVLFVSVAVVPAMWLGASHSHGDAHGHELTEEQVAAAEAGWPRPFDPAVAMDVSGIPGVDASQERRALDLIAATRRELPTWSTTEAARAAGYTSIRDAATGYEHYVNWRLLLDGKLLDPTAPESLVFRVDGAERTLVSAMFMAAPGTPMDDPSLTGYAGALMQWHIHDNLCWRDVDGQPVVAGITNFSGRCPAGTENRGLDIPMVHVWIVAHECGPFAAIEGIAAGTAAVSDSERVDLCLNAEH